jgi:putative spermidine/putrescine transport system ATP-binding protein
MSDRVAVFDHGRIEQVGAPREVYERPESLFVAGFVGTTNVLRDDVAERVLGRGGLWTVRPERIRIGPPGQPVADDEVTVTGQVHEVLYLGADTRYVVVIDGGGSLVATRHNVGTTDDLATPGLPVQLSWRREHAFALADPTDAAPAAPAATLPTDQSMTTTPGGATT